MGAVGHGRFEKVYYPEDHDGKSAQYRCCAAFECTGGDYEIPDRVTGTWIRLTLTSTRGRRKPRENKEVDGKWVPLVRWPSVERANGKPVSLLFIEVIAEGVRRGPFLQLPG